MGMGSDFDASGLNGLVWDDASQSFVLDPAVGQTASPIPQASEPVPQAPAPTYDNEGTQITDPNIIASMNGEVAPDWHGQASMTEAARMLAMIGQAPTPENGVNTAQDYRTPPMVAPQETDTTPAWMQGSIPQWSGAPAPQTPAPQTPAASGGLSPELETFYRRLVSDRAQGRTDPAGYDWKTDATVPDYAIPKGYSRIPPAGTTTGGTSNPQAPYQPPQGRQAPPQMYTPPQWNNTVMPMGAGIPQTGLNGANGHFGRQAEMVDLAAGLRNIAANSQGS